MKNFNNFFAILSFVAITSNAFAAEMVPPMDMARYKQLKSSVEKTNAANDFLNEYFSEENEVELPGMNCTKIDLEDGSKFSFFCVGN